MVHLEEMVKDCVLLGSWIYWTVSGMSGTGRFPAMVPPWY